MAKLLSFADLIITDITNCCGRELTGSEKFDGVQDDSMDEMVMPKCYFDHPSHVGPYIDLEKKQITFKHVDDFTLYAQDDCGDDICLHDINQGMIGDCWFLSAIDFSISSELYRESLKENVRSVDKHTVSVSLYDTKSGEWKTTYVDTRLLVNGDYIPTTLSVLSKTPSEIWPAMLEKGLAKMCGGYKNIEGGWMSEGMCFLHGGRGYFISSHDLVPKMLEDDTFIDRFATDLLVLYEKGYGFFTAWEKDAFTSIRKKGLVDSHAYSLLDLKNVDGEWVFKIKNPWGKFEWNGKYSDKDDSQHSKRVHKAMGLTGTEDGEFLMSAFDLFGRCEGIDIFEPTDETCIRCLHNVVKVDDDDTAGS
jgi:hypothetical protein